MSGTEYIIWLTLLGGLLSHFSIVLGTSLSTGSGDTIGSKSSTGFSSNVGSWTDGFDMSSLARLREVKLMRSGDKCLGNVNNEHASIYC